MIAAGKKTYQSILALSHNVYEQREHNNRRDVEGDGKDYKPEHTYSSE